MFYMTFLILKNVLFENRVLKFKSKTLFLEQNRIIFYEKHEFYGMKQKFIESSLQKKCLDKNDMIWLLFELRLEKFLKNIFFGYEKY